MGAELIGYDMKKNDATVSSLDWITYSSYVDGPCWMKYVDDNKFLDAGYARFGHL